jgi:tetratricopeptide (TPR) repeat protein
MAVNSWGYDLMSDNHLREAIELFKLNVQINPESGNALDSLGEAYMKSGQKQLAIESYKKSLEKDPSNENAKQKLKDLGGDTPAAWSGEAREANGKRTIEEKAPSSGRCLHRSLAYACFTQTRRGTRDNFVTSNSRKTIYGVDCAEIRFARASDMRSVSDTCSS